MKKLGNLLPEVETLHPYPRTLKHIRGQHIQGKNRVR